MVEYNISIRSYLEALGIMGEGYVMKGIIVCKNPRHTHKNFTPSLSITYDESSGVLKYHCFGLQEDGEPCRLRGKDFVKFFSIIEGVTYSHAKSVLGGDSGFVIDPERKDFFTKRSKKVEENKPGAQLPEVVSVFTKDNFSKFLLERGFSYEDVKIFSPMFSPDLNKYVILPIYSEDGKQISWVGRITNDKLSNKHPKEFPRYYNPYNSLNKQLLYGMWLPKISDILFIVEGPFDVIGTYTNGFSVLGVFGIKFASTQVLNIKRFFKKHKFKKVIVFFDYGADFEAKEMQDRLRAFKVPTDILTLTEEDLDIDPGNIDKEFLLHLMENNIGK